MRVKVQLGDKRQVVPVVGLDKERVTSLMAAIAKRYGIERVAELRTVDGFLLHPNDNVRDVVVDNDVLVALDYSMWLQENIKICNSGGRVWMEVSEPDFTDDQTKSVTVGWIDATRRLFVFCSMNRKPLRLEFFDPDELEYSDFDTDRDKVIFCETGAADGSSSSSKGKGGGKEEKKAAGGGTVAPWRMQASFEVGEGGHVTGVIVDVRSCTSVRDAIWRLPLTVKDGRVQLNGEKQCVQSSARFVPHDVLPTLPLPATVHQGPSYPESEDMLPNGEARQPAVEKKEQDKVENRSQGGLPLELLQKGDVSVFQGRCYDEQFDNMIMADFEMLNRGHDDLVIRGVKAEYKDKAGQWVACTARRGARYGYQVTWDDADASFTVSPKRPTPITLQGAITVRQPQICTHERLHQSLPDPLHLRFTLTDSNGAQTAITITATNAGRSLALQSREARVKSKGQEPFLWLQCDDTVAEGRIQVDGFHGVWSGRPYVELTSFIGNRSYYLDDLQKLGYTCAQTGQDRALLQEVSGDKDGLACTVHALVSVPHQAVYAFLVELKTHSSSASQAFLCPDLLAMQ